MQTRRWGTRRTLDKWEGWLRCITGRLALIGLVFFLVGHAHAQTPTKVRIGYTAVQDYAAVFVAKERGYFAKRGIDAELTLIPIGSTLPAALASRSLDVGSVTPPSLFQAANGGLKLTVVSGISRTTKDLNSAAIARTGIEVKQAKDFVGKKIGVPGIGATLQILVSRWLKTNGVDPRNVIYVEVAFPAHADTLKAGNIDIVGTAQPNIDRIIKAAIGYLAADLGEQFVGRGGVYWASTEKWAKANPEVARNFKEAIRDAGVFVAQNPDQAREDTAKYLKLPPGISASLTMPVVNADVPADDLAWWIDTLVDQGLIDKKFLPDDFIFK